ncbi:hypothetical protein N0V88_002103 [Collariella sp. IMI 366227]|nr:hypothetical protein N0V88_002103 [Collariella sp. IMI 366227]
MHLLNTETLRLESFAGSSIPDYAILSHTWDEEEILFGDICDPSKPLPVNKRGFAKIKGSCDQARQHEYSYIWIDACCIDKSSSAELSEAINSMFQWYQNSGCCYAYLADIDQPQGHGTTTNMIEDSRWFTRGWTLQELIAPRSVLFYDSNWNFIGERDDLSDSNALTKTICQRTGIPSRYCAKDVLGSASVNNPS